jgi:hypothetical protein
MDPPREVGGNRLAHISSRCLKSRRWRDARRGIDLRIAQQVVVSDGDGLVGIRPAVATTLRATFDITTPSQPPSLFCQSSLGFDSALLLCRTIPRSRRCPGGHRRVAYPRIDCAHGRRLR